MLEFIQEHWQLIVALCLSLVNFIITLCVHAKSSSKIKTLNTTTADQTGSVAEALLSVVALSKELINEIQSTKKEGSQDLSQDC